MNELTLKQPFIVISGEAVVADYASEYRQNGWWRDQTFLDDLRRGAARHPERPALITYRADGARSA